MAHEIDHVAAVLKRILEISNEQKRHIEENRLDALLRSQAERERLFAELEGIKGFRQDDSLKKVVNEIMANDNVLFMNLESAVCVIKGKLSNIRKGSRAMKAYSSV